MAATPERPGLASRYLDHLPAIFQEDAGVGRPNFLGRFLLAFEHVLTGLGEAGEPGLEEILDGIPTVDPATGRPALVGIERYFDPGPKEPLQERRREQAPPEFLPWLAGWVALTLRADLDELLQRDFIARAMSLYRLRGTRAGLEQLLAIYTRLGVTIYELREEFQIGVHSRVGVDTMLGGGGAHFFRVMIRLPTPDPAQIRRHEEVARAIIDLEKPAHTHYELVPVTPVLQIGVASTIGVDTLLGPRPD
jgi:phage tail-like protein